MRDVTEKWPGWLKVLSIVLLFVVSVVLAIFAADSDLRKTVKDKIANLRGGGKKEEPAPLD